MIAAVIRIEVTPGRPAHPLYCMCGGHSDPGDPASALTPALPAETGLQEALDDALGALTEDDIEYHTDPAGVTALEPNEPDLWVNYAALRAALSKEKK